MKQIFEILQEERDRILKIHESSTKNQYLNTLIVEGKKLNPHYLNEEKEMTFTQSRENILIPLPGKKRMQQFRLPQNQIWKQDKKGAITQKPGQSPIKFLCKGIKGKIENTTFKFNFYYNENWFRSETLGKALRKKFCPVGGTDSQNVTYNQYIFKNEFGDQKTAGKGAQITPNKDGSEIMVGIYGGLNQKMRFVCATGKYMYGGLEYTANSDKLKYRLLKDFCKKKEESNNTSTQNKNNSTDQLPIALDGTDDGTNVQTVRNVVKPNDSALETILTQIKSKSTPSPKPDEKTGPQTWEG